LKYVRHLALWLACVLLIVFAHAIIVDPVGVWGTRMLPDTNYAVHGRARVNGDRVIKGIELTRGTYDTMIFGTSRLQSGIDPRSREFQRERVYNAALPSGRIAEQVSVIETALKLHPEIRHAIWGIDYFVMISPETTFADFDNSIFNGMSALQGQFVRTFSIDSLKGSVKFWRSVLRGEPADMTVRGFHRQFSKTRSEQRPFFLRLAAREAERCHEQADLDAIAANVKRIAYGLQVLVDHGVSVDIVFPPTHVWMQSMAERSGALTVWEDIRTRVARQAERVSKTTPLPLKVWDFDHPGSVTSEALPAVGSQSKWFYEVSHARPSTGELMLRILKGTSTPDDPPDFARQLKPYTATALFQVARNDLMLWREQNPAEHNIVEGFIAKAGCPDNQGE
jgi:hypothetical protein